MKKYIFIILIFSALYSCKDPFGVEDNVRITPILKTSKLDLVNLQVGQRAKFTFFEITSGSYIALETKKLHSGDTLVMEVYGKSQNSWLFREYIIKGEGDFPNNVLRLDALSDSLKDTVEYKVAVTRNEFAAWMDGSSIFNSYMFKSMGNIWFSLDDYSDTLVKMSFWGSPFSNSQYNKGYMENFHHKGKAYDRLNILQSADNTKDVLSEIPLQIQIFSKKYGIVQRIMFHRPMNYRETIGYGWDLVDE